MASVVLMSVTITVAVTLPVVVSVGSNGCCSVNLNVACLLHPYWHHDCSYKYVLGWWRPPQYTHLVED